MDDILKNSMRLKYEGVWVTWVRTHERGPNVLDSCEIVRIKWKARNIHTKWSRDHRDVIRK